MIINSSLKMLTVPFLSLFLFFLFVSPAISSHPSPAIKSWCEQTPYPKPCEHFLTHNPKYKFPIKAKSDFLSISLSLALDRALHAQAHTYNLGKKCRNKLEKAAWDDCLELHEDIITKLNKTTHRSPKCTKDDVQTWLSSALTNLETCKQGFIELNVANYMLPLMSNNVTYLISNTLALNEGPFSHEPRYDYGYPTWVLPSDRKLLQAPAVQANVVVAQDGSGNFKTVKEAIVAASKRTGSARFVIRIKAGTYKENVEIGSKVKNVMLVGDGIGKTIITGSKSVGGGSTTFNSATVVAVGDGFIARGITFKNTAGPQNGQAVALRSGSDLSVFYQCSFEAYQDTLYVHSQRQFYRECDVYGTVDFIFGNAAVVLQNCNIYARKPQHNTNTITAQGRTDPNQNTGISIHNSRVTAAPDLKPVQGSVKTYLGRPWREYSRTVFMKTFLDGLIDPAGWLPWNKDFALKTLYYGEYLNTGPGSSTAKRVTWGGYHVINSATDASKFTVGSLFGGTSWLTEANVPFTAGL